ncbi:wax ester/triacylglycerol synthase domain-containing protein [Dactylosporangium sp. NPDC051484]|uniref:wax ester/triacylglycerol synthase domain-containing protein n=1 Tax=Dactylosporangium sp. NPDC051484 TaxID=3154942 RepID=UPI0034507D0D
MPADYDTITPGWQRLSIGELMTLWAQTPATPMNIAMLGLLSPAPTLVDEAGALRLAAVRSAVADRLDRAPALRRRIRRTRPGQGLPVWADDGAFDVARHVDAADLPGFGVDALLTWAATRAAAPLPDGRPPWRMTLVAGLGSGQVGLLLVMHHVLADGLTAVALAGALLDTAPDAAPAPTGWTPAPPPTGWTLARDAAADRLRALTRRLRTATRRPARPQPLTARRGPTAPHETTTPHETDAPHETDGPRSAPRPHKTTTPHETDAPHETNGPRSAHGPRETGGPRETDGLRRELRVARDALAVTAPDLGLPSPDGAERRAAGLCWRLDGVRRAAREYGVTVNDVMLAAVAGGMRGLLLARGVPVAGLTLRVSVPVAAPAGNRNAGGTLPFVLGLPVDEPDPAAALRRIGRDSRAAKAGRDRGYGGPAQSPLVPPLLVRLGAVWLRRYVGRRINLYLTNVPGPTNAHWLCGARLHTVFPIAPITAGVPVAVAVLSYDGTLSLTVDTGPGIDLRAFADGAGQTVAALMRTAEH